MDNRQKAIQSLRDIISYHLAMLVRYGHCFSVAVFSAQPNSQEASARGPMGEQVGWIKQFALLAAETVREIDFLAYDQYNNLVVVMPHTDLAGACAAAERVRAAALDRLGLHVCAGVAMALDGETNSSLLERANAALHQAATTASQWVWYHDGVAVSPAAELAEV